MIYRRRSQKNLLIVISIILIMFLTFSQLTKAEETTGEGSVESDDSTSESSESSNIDSESESSITEEIIESETSEFSESSNDNSESDYVGNSNGVYYELDEEVETVIVEELEDSIEEPEEQTLQEPEEQTLQEPEEQTLQESEEQTLQEPEEQTLQEPEEQTLQEPEEELLDNLEENFDGDELTDFESDSLILEESIGEQIDSNETENVELEGQYYEIEEDVEDEFINNTPVVGNVVGIENNQTNTTDYYVELEDLEDLEDNIDFDFSKIEQTEINFEEPVNIFQTLTIKNENDSPKEINFNLWNYQEEILEGMRTIQIFNGDELISEQPIFTLDLEANEEVEIKVIYEYPQIQKEIIKDDKTIMDLLPSQAKIISSEIPMETVVNEGYNIRIYHDGPLHYFDISVPIDEIDKDKIKSLYFVEGEEYLFMEENILMLPKLETQEDVQ